MKNTDTASIGADLLFNTAIDYLKNDVLIEGLAILELIKSIYPYYGATYCYLAWVNMHYYKNFEEAEILFQKAIELNPKFPETYHMYAEYLNLVQKGDGLLELHEKAKNVAGVKIELVLKQLGISFEKKKHYAKAIDVYEKALPLTIDADELDDLILAIDRCTIKDETSELE